MENTGKVFFEDDTPQWYIAVGERWVGPMSPSDVYQRVVSREISWAHYVWKPGQEDWKRICDTPTFQTVVPPVPHAKPLVKKSERAPKATPGPEKRAWFLYYNDTQFGPFSDGEIQQSIEIGKIHGRVHIWRDGMENWERLERVPQFKEYLKSMPPMPPVSDLAPARSAKLTPAKPDRADMAPPVSGEASSARGALPEEKEDVTAPVIEQRETPRQPLVAKILLSDDKTVFVGVCRDISVGGMQVLTDQHPGAVGAKIRLNVSPSVQTDKKFEPFVAKGVVVRFLEDKRGFSFRFEELTDAARNAIEKYVG